MDKIQEKFKNLIKNDKLSSILLEEKENLEVFKTDRDLSFSNYKVCIKVHIPFCLDKDNFIDAIIKDIEKFVSDNRNKIYYGFDIKGLENLSKEELVKFLNFCSKTTDFIQKSSDFEISAQTSFDFLSQDNIKLMAYCGIKRISFDLPPFKKNVDIIRLCRIYGIDKININLNFKNHERKDLSKACSLLQEFKPTHVTLLNTEVENFRYNNLIYKRLVKMGYIGQLGERYFSLNREDLGMSSFQRNTTINNVSYKGFECDSRSEEGFSYDKHTYLLPKEFMFNKYLLNSGEIGRLNIDIMQEILCENIVEKFKKEINFLKLKKYTKIEENTLQFTKKGMKNKSAIISLFTL